MRHEKRGYALIINHETFDDPGNKPRDGTLEDEKVLKETLKRLHFDVIVFRDYKKDEIESEMKKYAALDHSENDCILVIIMSHGDLGIIWAKDKQYTLDSIWTPFVQCSTLEGKPKLFFIQACQGSGVDDGIEMKSDTVSSEGATGDGNNSDATDATGKGVTGYKIPREHSDILIGYSTIPGMVSWRNAKGSWFMQTLSEELRKECDKENDQRIDILSLLTVVTGRVARERESHIPEQKKLHKKKQIPCVTHLLTRLLYIHDRTKK